MRPSFFIFSLPRSGSSWLSVFLTGQDSFCFHDPTADYSPAEWREHAHNRPESVVGGVDTGAYGFAYQIMESMPEAAFFALCRDPLDINRSSRAFGIQGFDAVKERQILDALHLKPIFYSKFNDLGYLSELWDEVIGTPFDEERACLLREMNIQRNFSDFLTHRPDLYRSYQEWVQ